MENKTGKYFKYAIGEIILVMIGILLALQVNNWNTNRSRAYLLLIFSVLAIFMYFFKKRFRAKVEKRNKE